MYLLRSGKMNEADVSEGGGTVLTATLGGLPLVGGTDVQKHLCSLPSPQLR
jgi:hypothetical protein